MSGVMNEDRRNAIISLVRRYQREKLRMPKIREICSALGIRSTATVHGYLLRLESEGLLVYDRHRAPVSKRLENSKADRL